MLAFQQLLKQRGLFTSIRKTRGDEIAAACGQLQGVVKDRTTRSAKMAKNAKKLTLSFKEERMTADQVNKTESATTTSSIDSPGKLLTEARIGKNLSIDDVAALMCVTTRLVKSIEKDDYPNQRVDIFLCTVTSNDIMQNSSNRSEQDFAKLESLGFKSHNTSASITKASHKQVVALTQDKAKKYLICTVLFMLASLSVLVIGQHAENLGLK